MLTMVSDVATCTTLIMPVYNFIYSTDHYTLTLRVISEEYSADNVTVTVEWTQFAYATYNVIVVPLVPIVFLGSTNR